MIFLVDIKFGSLVMKGHWENTAMADLCNLAVQSGAIMRPYVTNKLLADRVFNLAVVKSTVPNRQIALYGGSMHMYSTHSLIYH